MNPAPLFPARTIAGYRVLRRLARGDRCEIALGFDAGTSTTVVLKVSEDPEPLAREAEALARARGDHVVGLGDVACTDGATCLVLDRLERGSLADLLSRRARLDPGEIVTIVAPLAATLARLHRAGVAHGDIGAGAVAFSADGAPVLVGFGRAALFAPGSPEIVLEADPDVVGDRRALVRLVLALLDRSTTTLPTPDPGLGGRLTAEAALHPDDLAALLFEIAEPRPVRFDDDVATTGDADDDVAGAGAAVLFRSLATHDDAAAIEEVRDRDRSVPTLAALAAVLPDAVRDRVSSVLTDPRLLRVRDRWRMLSTGRRRLLAGGAAAAVTLVGALAFVPGTPAPDSAAPVVSPSAAPGIPDPAPTMTAVEGDDPVAALVDLWTARRDCLLERSVLCLDAVDQAGSAALDTDRDLIAGGPDAVGGPEPIVVSDLVLVERLGDTALVAVSAESGAASVLLVRDDGGWRIREYLAARIAGS